MSPQILIIWVEGGKLPERLESDSTRLISHSAKKGLVLESIAQFPNDGSFAQSHFRGSSLSKSAV